MRTPNKEIINESAKANFLDRTIGFFAPRLAVERFRARMTLAVAGAWTGASKNRRQTSEWKIPDGDTDQLILDDLDYLRKRSGDAFRNLPLATGAIKTNCTAVVGPGLKLQPQIDREVLGLDEDKAHAWERKAQREFKSWSESPECHAQRTMNFGEIQKVVFMSTMLKGDCFVSMPSFERKGSEYKLKLQVIDAERVSNPNFKTNTLSCSAGVEKDEHGAPEFYHVASHHPSRYDGDENNEWKKIRIFGRRTGRRNVLHLYENIMPDQTRGIPYLAPVIEQLKMIDRFTEAELMAAVVSSFFTVFITSESGDGNLSPMQPTSEIGGSSSDDSFKMGPGAILGLSPDEDVETANPSRPNTAFDPFVTSILRQIAVALELPFELLIKHFTSSYSASRAAILEAWRFFIARRKWLSQKLCDPVYAAWMDEAVASRRIAAPGYFKNPMIRRAYLGASWNGPARGHIDEQKEITAAEKRIQLGVSTGAQETAEINGGDFDKNVNRLKREILLKKDAGMGLDSKSPPEQPSPPQQTQKTDQEDLDDETS